MQGTTCSLKWSSVMVTGRSTAGEDGRAGGAYNSLKATNH